MQYVPPGLHRTLNVDRPQMYHLPLLPGYGPGSNIRSSAAPASAQTPVTEYPIPQPSDTEEPPEELAYFSAPTPETELDRYVPSTSPPPEAMSETETEIPQSAVEEGPPTPRPHAQQVLVPDPETFAEAVFLAYGVVVFFGLDESQEHSILEDVQAAGVMQKAIKESRWEIEECHYEV